MLGSGYGSFGSVRRDRGMEIIAPLAELLEGERQWTFGSVEGFVSFSVYVDAFRFSPGINGYDYIKLYDSQLFCDPIER